MQTLQDQIEYLKRLLPNYEVKESKTKRGIHLRSPNEVGISERNHDAHWVTFFNAIKEYFGDRFQEVFHNTCTNHADFTIYLRQD